jgi:2-iminobutanoate/2-iminopropanoate deaminase
MKEFRNPQAVHQPVGGYMHQAELTGNERMLIVSGQIGMTQDGTVPDDPIEQLDLALENIFRNLQAADMDMKDLVKINYYLVGEWDTVKRRELIASRYGEHKPCSTLVYVAGLADPIYKVK